MGENAIKCKRVNNLQIHHLHYDNIFHEKIEDVRVLCKKHHEEVHGIKPTKEKKLKLTPIQVESKKAKRARRKEKRAKKKIGKLVQDRMYRQHLQAQKPKSKQAYQPGPKLKPHLPSANAILQKKQDRIAWQMRVVE